MALNAFDLFATFKFFSPPWFYTRTRPLVFFMSLLERSHSLGAPVVDITC